MFDSEIPFFEEIEQPLPSQWTWDKLKKHLEGAMLVELSTIPLYLYPYYSIKMTDVNADQKKAGTEARRMLRIIFQQEMLHLTLAGNILRSIGGQPKLYDPSRIPTYPNQILDTRIRMNLKAATKDNIECFEKIEAPAPPPPPPPPPNSITIDKYKSIGEFYEGLKRGIVELSTKGELNFAHEHAQFDGVNFFDGDSMFVIKNAESALKALTLIVEQGEGGPDKSNSHYQMFGHLVQISQSWVYHDMVENPPSGSYEGGVKNLADAFDAGYCYLLLTIESFWDAKTPDRQRQVLSRNIHAIMSNILTALAHFIVQQKVGTKQAGPRFRFYPVKGPPLDALHSSIKIELQAAMDSNPQWKSLLSPILLSVERVVPPQ